MRIGIGLLSENEKQLFIDILFECEGAIAFDDSEMGLLKPEIKPPVVIHTVPHAPWQQASLRLPKAMQDIATERVKRKISERHPRIFTRTLPQSLFSCSKEKSGRIPNDQ